MYIGKEHISSFMGMEDPIYFIFTLAEWEEEIIQCMTSAFRKPWASFMSKREPNHSSYGISGEDSALLFGTRVSLEDL